MTESRQDSESWTEVSYASWVRSMEESAEENGRTVLTATEISESSGDEATSPLRDADKHAGSASPSASSRTQKARSPQEHGEQGASRIAEGSLPASGSNAQVNEDAGIGKPRATTSQFLAYNLSKCQGNDPV